MTTLTVLVANARLFLKDATKVTDDELISYAGDAVVAYSYDFPKTKVAAVTPAANLITIPTDALPTNTVIALEAGGEMWPEIPMHEMGGVFPTTGKQWYWYGEQLKLATTPSSTVYLHYSAIRTIPVAYVPEVLVPPAVHDPLYPAEAAIDVPRADEEMIVLYMAVKFHQKIGTVAAKLDRFREKGSRDDNPMVFMHETLMRRYYQMVAERRTGGVRYTRGS